MIETISNRSGNVSRSMGTATIARLALLALLVCGPAGAAVPSAQKPGQAPARTGKEPYRETDRGPAHSLIEIEISPGPQSFATGMVVLFKAVYDIAKERNFAYAFAPEQAANASPPQSGAPGVVRVKVFMTKDREMPLRALLAGDYSERAQAQFDREGWMSIRQLARMFEGDNRAARASDPLSDLIGVYSLRAEGEPSLRVSKVGPDYFLESRQGDGWGKPTRLAAIAESERAKAAKSGVIFSAGLRMNQGSADQNFDILRIEEALPGSGKTVVLHVLFSRSGPNMLYKLP